MGPKRTTPRHIRIKMPKVKDKEINLKAAGKKQIVTYKGVPIGLSADDFSKETLQARRDWQEVFKEESKDLQPRLLYPESYHLEWKGR